MVQADNKVDDNELVFMHNIKNRLKKLSDEKIIVHFPRHLDILLDLGKFSAKPLQSNLETIDLNAFDNLNLTDWESADRQKKTAGNIALAKAGVKCLFWAFVPLINSSAKFNFCAF